jgi:hypothetical protein
MPIVRQEPIYGLHILMLIRYVALAVGLRGEGPYVVVEEE